MGGKQRICRWLALATCALLIAHFATAANGAFGALSTADQQRLHGGQCTPIAGYCIFTNTGCSDPKIPAGCSLYMGSCASCTMRVSSWTNCVAKQGAGGCCQVILPTSPWCGVVYTQRPNPGCPNTGRCATLTTMACGQQIPSVAGVPCQ